MHTNSFICKPFISNLKSIVLIYYTLFLLKKVKYILSYTFILYICIINILIRTMNEQITKTFDLYDFRQNQSKTFCKSMMFEVIKLEEKSNHILATIKIAGNKDNIVQYKYDFKGRFWGDSND